MTGSEFELAWRLRPESWSRNTWSRDDGLRSDPQAEREKQLAKKVMVDGEPMSKVSDTNSGREHSPDSGYVGLQRLSDICKDLRMQFFGSVG